MLKNSLSLFRSTWTNAKAKMVSVSCCQFELISHSSWISVVVLEMWATWCPPCRTSIPHLTDLQKKFKGKCTRAQWLHSLLTHCCVAADQGVIFIGVSNEQEPAVKRFVEQMGSKMDYRVAIDPKGVTSAYTSKYNVRGIP